MAAVGPLHLQQQLSLLRREKGITQEELASSLGVTNQAVSKWESGVCCPDIQLLPALAAYFGVTVDRLLGCEAPKEAEQEATLHKQLHAFLNDLPREEVFGAAYRLAARLHDGVCRKMGTVPWNADQPYSREEGAWGCSVCSEPEGTTIHSGGTVLLSDSRFFQPLSGARLRKIQAVLQALCEADVLPILFALYAIRREDMARFVSLPELAAACRLPEERVSAALEILPLEYPEDSADSRFRLADPYLPIPALLALVSFA